MHFSCVDVGMKHSVTGIQTKCPILGIKLSLTPLHKYFLAVFFHETNVSGQTWKGTTVCYLSDAAILMAFFGGAQV